MHAIHPVALVRCAAGCALLALLPAGAVGAGPEAPAVAAAAPGPVLYRVGSRPDGGTLWGVAKLFYGDGSQWDVIFAANTDVLADPEVLPSGAILRIPSLDAPVAAGPVEPDAPSTALAPLVSLDRDRIYALSAAAIRARLPAGSTNTFQPGHIIVLGHPDRPRAAQILVHWVGREALELLPGETRETDAKRVQRFRVRFSVDGQLLDVAEDEVWLQRAAGEP